MASGTRKQLLWQAERLTRELQAYLVPREERTAEKLRMKDPGDRILVLRYLHETRQNGGLDREQWRKLNPELHKRLLDICPTRAKEEA